MKVLLMLLLSFFARAETPIPREFHPVMDYANVLSTQDKDGISDALISLKNDAGVQMGVLVLPDLDGQDIESVSINWATKWKLGSKSKDDGVLFVLALKEHRMRLEVGQGLEGILPDAKAREITESTKQFLRHKQYAEAIVSVVNSVAEISKAGKDQVTEKPHTENGSALPYVISFLAGLGIIGVVSLSRSRKEAARKREEARLKAEQDRDRINAQQIASMRKRSLEDLLVASAVASSVKKKTTESSARPRKEESSTRHDDDSFRYASSPISEDYSSSSSSSFDSYSSGSSSSDWGGGGGDFSGGGSSDSW